MGFRYVLRLADGDEAGEAVYAFQPDVGDVIYVDGNRRVRRTRCWRSSRSRHRDGGLTGASAEAARPPVLVGLRVQMVDDLLRSLVVPFPMGVDPLL
jgi:hypothetical protein